MKKIIVIILLVILVGAGGMLLKKRRQTITDTPVATPVTSTVRTVRPQTRTVSSTRTFLARLEAAGSATISSKLSGRIRELPVRESQKVRQGELLVRIDNQEIVAAIDGLRATLVSARKQLVYRRAQHERNKALFEAGGLAREKLEASELAGSTAEATVKDLEQKIRALEVQLDYLDIRAPFNGIIGTVFLRRGDLAAPGRPIVSLNSFKQKLTFRFVPDKDDIRPGQDVLLHGEKIGRTATMYSDASAGLAVAEVALDHQMDRPNDSYLTIRVVTGRATGCAVPVQALLHRQQGTSLMLYKEDRFEPLPVTVKVRDNEYAVIEPPVTSPVAVAAEARLSLLPTYGRVRVLSGKTDE